MAEEIYLPHRPNKAELELTRIVSRHQKQMEQIVNDYLQEALTRDGPMTETDIREANSKIRAIDTELRNEANAWLQNSFEPYYRRYISEADKQLRGAGLELASTVSGATRMHRYALHHLQGLFQTGMSEVYSIVARKTDDIFRQVQLQSAMDGFADSDNVKQVIRNLREQLRNRGLTGFVDSAGREWRLETYADTAARTVTSQARLMAMDVEFTARDMDLVAVSLHYPTCKYCEPWGGKILSLHGKTRGYPTMAEARAAKLYHPNCLHGFTLVVPGKEPRVPTDKEAREANRKARERAEEELAKRKRR